MGLRVHQTVAATASDNWTPIIEAPTGCLHLFITGAATNVPMGLAVRQGDATNSTWRMVRDTQHGRTTDGLYTSSVGVITVGVVPGLAYRLGVSAYTSGTATGAIFG